MTKRYTWLGKDKRAMSDLKTVIAMALEEDGSSVNNAVDAIAALSGGGDGVMPWPVMTGSVIDSRTVYSATTSEAATTANRRYALPLIIRQACTIDSIGVRIVTGVGSASVVRFGLYEVILTAGPTFGMPGALIGDYGTADAQWSSNSARVYPDVQLEAGVYFMVAAFEGAPTVQMIAPTSQGPGGENYEDTTRNGCLYASGGYDALPDPFGGLGGKLVTGPRLWVEISY